MRPILNRKAPLFVILFSSLLTIGCAADPGLQADRAVERANEDIAAHDELFDEARNAYSQARASIRESRNDGGGEGPDEPQGDSNPDGDGQEGESQEEGTQSLEDTQEATNEETERIGEARDKLREAREQLQSAREEISGIQELEVSEDLMEYSRTLEQALAAQIRAEEREISFYELLAEDPTLQENRDRATDILSEASDAYAEAESGYEEAREIADSNPEFAAPEGS